ncbi:polysaccharide biosynthesis/export family protein [Hyphomicrobium sp.]|uniref:polysaccharide biosynthesis/export family protein n=1 Tax=Hyphomicrobium sp. TaxID=82 RepID=UPI002D786784|nr:polysaccharide biosynthesis/export family protein [Hyphomicrobium sp.]HET6389072.1 polysaccharide biosynthesis/export family protein [Hyphomicrobium sp.]
MSVRLLSMFVATLSVLAGACSPGDFIDPRIAGDVAIYDDGASVKDGYPLPVTRASAETVVWGTPAVYTEVAGPAEGPYLLDTGDRLRIFVYGQPNLSRLYIVNQEGKISVPLIGNVTARGKTTNELQGIIRSRLGSEYVKDPQVTVDIQQNRPFFILGEVKNAGQYPYVSGMTVETAVAIAGGYTERASERSFRVKRRVNGFVQDLEVPGDFPVRPSDTVYVFERFF